jgi:dTDP-4-dehydrorhamnose reductase
VAVILITGANGQLGSEINNLSRKYLGYDFIFTDIDTLDITNREQTFEFIKKNEPDWIINCAAYNLVDKAESEPEKAMLINAEAVRNIAESISGSECKFIHVSTDYVFDGNSNVPYNENTPANPVTAYGKSKYAGELAALRHNRSMVIRTSWLYSPFGSNFVKTIMAKAKERDMLKVVFDQIGSPTYAGDLASAITEIVALVIRNKIAFIPGIYHYSNEGVCSWYDFAEEIIKEAGISCKVLPILSTEYPSPARRPFYSVLDKSKIKETYNIYIPHWRSSLISCIKLM